ncbi:MAG: DUF4124 domain-containing protein [Betaproteobacteria bacterium]|nr:DUF4124 domain-containing protein [Betaproteobacteria bacterium]
MKATFRTGFVIAAILAAASAQADVYKCVDPVSGRITYTNSKTGEKGCTLLQKEQAPVSSIPSPVGRRAASAASPAEFPKVDSETQRSRDDDRRKILETELATETQALEDAKKALAEQESVRFGNERNFAKKLERLKPFQEQVDLHERNIEAIRTEIGRLR